MEKYLFNVIAKAMNPFTTEANLLIVWVRDKGIIAVSAFYNGDIYHNEDRQYISASNLPSRAWNKLYSEKRSTLLLFA